MLAEGEPHAFIESIQQPEALSKDVEQLGSRPLSRYPRRSARRSWYSQTFSDDECDGEVQINWQLSSRCEGFEESSFFGANSAAARASADCGDADANSDASTDVGSDDDVCGAGQASSLPSSTKKQSKDDDDLMQATTDLIIHPEDKAAAACKKQASPEELAATAERRLLKRQRHRQERREQRTRERNRRSGLRKAAHKGVE